jgi:hypothetical protein
MMAAHHSTLASLTLRTAGTILQLSPLQLLGAAWIVVEAGFYLACHMVAWSATRDPGPMPWGDEKKDRRRELWHRILSDPSQSPADFLGGWFYRPSISPAPVELLAHWIARRAQIGTSSAPHEALPHRPSPARAPSAAARSVGKTPAAPAGSWVAQADLPEVPHSFGPEPGGVSYAELTFGDAIRWLSRALYHRTCDELDAAQAAELREVISELELVAGTSLRRPEDALTAPGASTPSATGPSEAG